MKSIVLTGTFVCLLFSIACKNKSAEESENSSNQNVDNTKGKNFKVSIPSGWMTRDTVLDGVRFYFLIAPKNGENVNTSINITHEPMQQMSLLEYGNNSIVSMKQHLPGFEVLEEGDMQATGMAGHWFRYTMKPYKIKSDLISYTFPKDNIAYTITATTTTSNMDKYRNTFDSVARSFKLVD